MKKVKLMNKKMRVVFCGTPPIAADLLESLVLNDDVEVVGVISQPDKLQGRKQVLTPTPVKLSAQKHQLPCFQPKKISDLYARLQTLEFDFLLTCAYGQFIPLKILKLARCEALNIHGSLLPQYRGGAPIQRAIMNGETTTGVSLMRMVQQMDAGPVFATLKTSITPKDDSGSLFSKISDLGQKILADNLKKIYQGLLLPTPQDSSQVSYAPIITPAEEQIDWSQSAEIIKNQVRALAPTPIAYSWLNHERYKIKTVRIVESSENISFEGAKTPGKVIGIDKEGIVVQTGQGMIKILEIQRQGKKMLLASAYFINQLRDINVGVNFDIIKTTK